MILLLCLVKLSLINAQEVWTLSTVMTKALDQNHGIKLQKTQQEIVENDVRIGNAGLLPTIDLVAGANLSNQIANIDFAGGIAPLRDINAVATDRNVGVRLSYTLFDGLANFYSYDRLKLNASISDLQTKLMIESTIMQVVELFYGVLKFQQELAIQQMQVAISQDRLNRSTLQHQYGTLTSLELLNVQVDYYADSTQLIMLQNNLSQRKNQLKYYLGEDLALDFELEGVLDDVQDFDFEELKQNSLQNQSSVLLTMVELEAAEVDKKLVRARYLPQLSLVSQYGLNISNNNAGILLKNESYGFTGGLNFRWNLFDGNQRKTALDKAALMIDAAEEKKIEAEQKIILEVMNYYQELSSLKAILALNTKSILAATQNLNRTKELYYNGQITQNDFRQAQVNLQKVMLLNLDTQIQYKVAALHLSRLANQLIQ